VGVLSIFFAGGYALDGLYGEAPAFFSCLLVMYGCCVTLVIHEKIGRFLMGFLMALMRARMR
jgi:hypothetical protein